MPDDRAEPKRKRKRKHKIVILGYCPYCGCDLETDFCDHCGKENPKG